MISKYSISPALISWYNQKKLPNIMHFRHDFYTGYRIAQLLNLILGKKFPLTSFLDETSTKVAKNNWERILFYQKELNLPLKLTQGLIELIIDKDPQECERQILECLINIYEMDTKIPYPRQTISTCPRSIALQITTRGGFSGTVLATNNDEDDQEEGLAYPKNVPMFCRRSYVNSSALINHLNNACTGALSSVEAVSDQIEMLDPRVDCCYPFPGLVLHLPAFACKDVCRFLLRHLDVSVVSQHVLGDFSLFYDVACLVLHSAVALNQATGDALEIFDLATEKLCAVLGAVRATSPATLQLIYQNVIINRLFKELPLINFSVLHLLRLTSACVGVVSYLQIEEWFGLVVKNLKLYQPYVNENRLRFEAVAAFVIFAQKSAEGAQVGPEGQTASVSASQSSQAAQAGLGSSGASGTALAASGASQTAQTAQATLVEAVCRLSMKCCKCSEILPESERFAAFDLIIRTICLNPALHETLDFLLFKMLYSFVNHLRTPQSQQQRALGLSRTTSQGADDGDADMCTLVFNRNGRNFKLRFTYDRVHRLNFDQVRFIVVALSQLRVVHNYNFQQSINSFLQGLGYIMLNRDQYPLSQYLIGVMLVVKNQKDLIYTIAQSLQRNLVQPLDEKELQYQKAQLRENRILKVLLQSLAVQAVRDPKFPCRLLGVLTRERTRGEFACRCYAKPYYKAHIYSFQQFDRTENITCPPVMWNGVGSGMGGGTNGGGNSGVGNSGVTQQSGRGRPDPNALAFDALAALVPGFAYEELLALAGVIDPEGLDEVTGELALLVAAYVTATAGVSSAAFKALFQLVLAAAPAGIAVLQLWPDAVFGAQLAEAQLAAEAAADLLVLSIAATDAAGCLPAHREALLQALAALIAIAFGPAPPDGLDRQGAQDNVAKLFQKLARDSAGLALLRALFASPDAETFGNDRLETIAAEVLHADRPE